MDLRIEEISQKIVSILYAKLPAELANLEQIMNATDQKFYTQIGQPVPTTALPTPAAYFLGHQPRLLEKPSAEFPNITVMCYAQETIDNEYDTLIQQGLIGIIDVFVYSEDENEVNRLIQRYTRAVVRVMDQYRTLGGMVQDSEVPPDIELSDAIPRRESRTSNKEIYIQGARLGYIFPIIQENF